MARVVSTYWAPGLGRHLVRRPSDAVPLVRAGWRLRRRSWWLRPPFLPVPDPAYWHFRMVTANGSAAVGVSANEMVDAAKWSLRQKVGR